MNKKVSTVGSYKILAKITDCNGILIQPAQVSAVKVKISEYLAPDVVVDGYDLYPMDLAGLYSSIQTDETGFEYNFAGNPYHDAKPMFPRHETTYLVELVWYDQDNRPYAGPTYVDSL